MKVELGWTGTSCLFGERKFKEAAAIRLVPDDELEILDCVFLQRVVSL